MCDPVSIIAGASLAFSVGSQVAGASAQNKASKANAAAARRAFREANRDIALLQSQEKGAHAINVFDMERQARAAAALAEVSAGEASVTGTSVRELIQDIDRERAEAESRATRNLADRMAGLEREKISGRTVMQERIASVPGANTFGTIIGIGSTVAGFGATALELNRGKAGAPKAPALPKTPPSRG